MKNSYKITIGIVIVVLVLVGLIASSYNGLVRKSQAVDGAWAQVQTDYQRRADLVPNLVETVKGAAKFEQQTLTDVVNARAKATSININASDLTSENITKYESAQTGLSQSLGRLIAIAENYPTLTATENFRGLQTQLEGTENRIAVSRKDFNNAVVTYNSSVQTFPAVIIAHLFGFNTKAYFQSDQGANIVPKVNF